MILAEDHNAADSHSHFYPQIWLIFMSAAFFGLYIALDQGLLHDIVAIDRSYLSWVLALLFIVMTCHAFWHIVQISSHIRLADELLDSDTDTKSISEQLSRAHGPNENNGFSSSVFLRAFIDEALQSNRVNNKEIANDPDATSVLDIYADKLRSPVELGWYMVDLAIRMGLIGTIIGFILIFSTLSGNAIPKANEMQTLLISMSSGMGTALYTTLCGLVCATILGIQYLILGREVEHFISLLVRLRNRAVVRL